MESFDLEYFANAITQFGTEYFANSDNKGNNSVNLKINTKKSVEMAIKQRIIPVTLVMYRHLLLPYSKNRPGYSLKIRIAK